MYHGPEGLKQIAAHCMQVCLGRIRFARAIRHRPQLGTAILRRAGVTAADADADVGAWAGMFPRAVLRARAAVAGEADGAVVHAGDVVTVSIDLEVRALRFYICTPP